MILFMETSFLVWHLSFLLIEHPRWSIISGNWSDDNQKKFNDYSKVNEPYRKPVIGASWHAPQPASPVRKKPIASYEKTFWNIPQWITEMEKNQLDVIVQIFKCAKYIFGKQCMYLPNICPTNRMQHKVNFS